jgi:hypothetical protein
MPMHVSFEALPGRSSFAVDLGAELPKLSVLEGNPLNTEQSTTLHNKMYTVIFKQMFYLFEPS